MGKSAGDLERGKIWQVLLLHLREAEKLTALSSIEYPHWLMIAGALLLMLGCVGLALRQRGGGAHPLASGGDSGPSEPEADPNQVEVYHRKEKEKRRDRWADRFGDSDEPLEAGVKTGSNPHP